MDGRRRCAHESCGTVLSRYNEGKYCWAHDDPDDAERSTAYIFRLNRELKDDRKHRPEGKQAQ